MRGPLHVSIPKDLIRLDLVQTCLYNAHGWASGIIYDDVISYDAATWRRQVANRIYHIKKIS